MLREAEWKRRVRKKEEEIKKIQEKIKKLKKETKDEYLKQLEKELKFYLSLNNNLNNEVEKRKIEIEKEKENYNKQTKEIKKDFKVKEKEISKLKKEIDNKIEEKIKIRKEFGKLILEEEFQVKPQKNKIKTKTNNKLNNKDIENIKEEIKNVVEEIQNLEEKSNKLFNSEDNIIPLQGLHYTKNKEILLTLDGVPELEDDVVFYSLNGRNVELFLEFEDFKKTEFLNKIELLLKNMFSQNNNIFKPQKFVSLLVENEKCPKPISLIISNYIKYIFEKQKPKKIQLNKKKKN